MWQVGTGWKLAEAAGVSGSVPLPSGASIILIVAHSTSGGTVQILGGVTVPIIGGANQFTLQNYHPLHQANAGSAAKTLVFSGTDSFYVQYATPGNV